MKQRSEKKRKENRFQAIIEVIMVLVLTSSFIPMLLMIMMSFKSTWEVYNNFFGLPRAIQWSNYVGAVRFLIGNMWNTLGVVLAAVLLTLVLSTLGGYVFATKTFPGKNFLFSMIVVTMMIPGVLSLAANYTLIIEYGLLDSSWALILHWVTGGQVLGIILCRNSIEALPRDLYEAARIEGCGEFHLLTSITVPLVKPILSTVAVLKVVDYYNDFIWPMMVIESNRKQVVTVVLKVFTSSQDLSNVGIMFAGYVIATIPLLILFLFTSRLYMEGLTAGAVKG
ncbi:MAG: carbohydrate ABC transporter permease [Hungatella sp.]|nr:carbohydrate ABC transporter permease [Hungatella sp.]